MNPRHRPRDVGALAFAFALALACCVPRAFAQDHADIDPTQVIGNRELPKVLYIVPWKKPLPGEHAGRPPTSVIDEALAPIDRDVFRRQLRYDALEQARAAAAAPAPPSTGAPASLPAPAAR